MVWMPSNIYDGIKGIACVSGMLWVKTSSKHYQETIFFSKWLIYLHYYLQTINIKRLFVHKSGNKQSKWKWLGQVRQLGHV